VKKYLIIIIITLAAVTANFYISWKTQKENAQRWEHNYEQLQDTLSGLITLKNKEIQDYVKNELRGFAKEVYDSLNIKSKQVVEITEQHNHYHLGDTVFIQPSEPIISQGEIKYPVYEKMNCMTIAGYMVVKDTVPSLVLTEETGYDNTTVYIQYWERQKYTFPSEKFRLWRWKLWGRKVNELHSQSKCGDVTIQRINVIKK